jgi:predicted hydrocarbon binding protein
MENKEMISKDEAFSQLKSMITRTALIHYAFTKTIIDELGKEKGKELAKKAIRLYGQMVGKKVRENTLAKGLPTLAENFQNDLPALGWADREKVVVEGEKRARVHTCYLAETWKELGVPEIGRLYCFVDQAKYEAYNPELECLHTKNVLDGDPYCELAVRSKKKKK